MRAILGILLLAAAAACPRGGDAGGGAAGGAPANIEAACVLVSEGAICSFTNKGGAGSRCVKVMYGASSGTVVASNDVCTGRLPAQGILTVVIRFPTRPAELCGDGLTDCQVKAVDPAAAPDVMLAWQNELKASYDGPLTQEDCKKLVKVKYDFYMREDCRGMSNPVDKKSCEQSIVQERDREMPYLIQECMSYYTRELYKCMMVAKTIDDLYRCEDQFMR